MDNFASPAYDYSAQLAKVERRKKLALAIQQQGLEPLQGSQVGGVAIPISPLQGLAKLAQTWAGEKMASKAETEQQGIAKQSQADYKTMLVEAMRKMQSGDTMGAIGDFSSHPQGANMLPLAMQQYQNQQWQKSFNGGGQQPPQVGQGTVLAPGAEQQAPQGGQGGGMDLNNPGAWLNAPPGAVAFMNNQSKQHEALGGAQADQNGMMYVTTKSGGVTYLKGPDGKPIMARDKLNFQDTGGNIQGVNEFTGQPGGAPIQKGLSPADQQRIPMEQTKVGIDQQQAALAEAKARDEGIAVPSRKPLPISGPQPIGPQMQKPIMPPEPQAIPIPAPRPMSQGPITPLAPISPKQQREIAAKRTEEQPKAQFGLQSARTKAANVIGKVDEAMKQVGFMTAGAAGYALGMVPGTGAYDLDKTIDTIRANIGFKELQDMRAASPTGGALGAVSEKELKYLESAVSSLTQGQSPTQLRQRLGEIKQHYENWLKAVEQSYSSQYGRKDFGDPTSSAFDAYRKASDEYQASVKKDPSNPQSDAMKRRVDQLHDAYQKSLKGGGDINDLLEKYK